MTDVSAERQPVAIAQRPTIPESEFAARLQRVQRLAESLELDAIVVYGDDRATMGAGHVRWLIDYFPHFEPIAVLVAPGVDPIAVTGPESDSYIESTSRLRGAIAVTEEFVHPDEEYPFTTVEPLASVLDRLLPSTVGAARRVGLAGSEMISPRLLDGLRQQATIVPVDQQYGALRARKSPAELAVIRYAYEIAQEGVLAAVRAISSGEVSERDVGAEIDYALRRWGAEGSGIDTIVAAGPEHTYPILHRTSTRMIRPGDAVILTVAPRYEGYHGAIGRTVHVGDVDTRLRDAREVAIAAQRHTAELLVAGAHAPDVDRAARGVVRDAGYGDYFLYTGIHSIGVMEFEPPILASFDTTTVEEDMVFSVDIPMFHTPWGGLRAENGYHVAPGGAVPLQTVADAIDIA
ncbi:M24 family metallopeptidase [Schumannella soli]|uniref:Aminopeptidase P family protein n=1 Tax=Schumannella soli TaxID=2590779 RepID=A0A506XX37_9MICO|nr:Xaa-Pro peptidase family protein [Schumannella soli]TPW77464.1 aminopeptidase P family protein [Schumannella soli]